MKRSCETPCQRFAKRSLTMLSKHGSLTSRRRSGSSHRRWRSTGPSGPAEEDGRRRKARIMRTFGAGLSSGSPPRMFVPSSPRWTVRTFLLGRSTSIARFFIRSSSSRGARTALASRQILQPRRRSDRRDGSKPIEIFEPDEIRAIADAARIGLHRGRGGYAHSVFSAETDREWKRINEQDAALFTFAFTGLRRGELLALRWRDVDLDGGVAIVSRAMSDGKETSTKSRKPRSVPLAEQAKDALRGLRKRHDSPAATISSSAGRTAGHLIPRRFAGASSGHRKRRASECGASTI
jgi:integrase